MSVPIGKRSESSMEFLSNARDIEIIFIELRIKKPKRYTFFFDKLLEYSFNLLSTVKAGNSIYPENKSEVEMRQRFFKEGIAYCQVLMSQIEVIRYKLQDDGISINQVQQLSEKIVHEIKLLKGIISSDKDRYKNILKDINKE